MAEAKRGRQAREMKEAKMKIRGRQRDGPKFAGLMLMAKHRLSCASKKTCIYGALLALHERSSHNRTGSVIVDDLSRCWRCWQVFEGLLMGTFA